MTDAFEKWINSMSDAEYEDMLDDPDGFTDAQEEKALNIRERPTPDEMLELEKEQEFTEPEPEEEELEEEAPSRAPIREPRRFSISREQPETIPIETSREPIGIDLPDRSFVPRERPQLPRVEPPRPEPRKITERVRQAVQSTGKFLRRFFGK